jgi:hypothetical protein
MSVWDTPATRLGTARSVFGASRVLFDKAYGTRVYPILDPDEEATGWNRETEWDEVAEDLDWEEPEDEPGDLFVDDVEAVKRVLVGSEAIYCLIKAIWDKDMEFKANLVEGEVQATLAETVHLVAPSTQVNREKFIKATLAETTHEKLRTFEAAYDALVYLVKSPNWEEQDDEYEPLQIRNILDTSHYVYRKVNGVHLFFGKDHLKEKVLAFSRNSFQFVVEAVSRIVNLLDYSGRAWWSHSARRQAFHDLLKEQIYQAARLRGTAADRVSKCWHEVRMSVQYSLLKSIMKDATTALAEDFVKDGLDHVITLRAARKLIMQVDEATTMELAHIYKWMPPPEYDITKSLPAIRDLHRNPRTSGAHAMASAEQKELYKDIQDERKMNLLATYKARFGKYPDNLAMKGKRPTIIEAAAWDHKASLNYEQMGEYVSSQIKDKTTVKASMTEEMDGNHDIYDQNYLLWYLTNKDTIDTRKDLLKLANGTLGEEAYSRVAYKAEGPKIDGRPFFMAPPRTRLLLGEFEGNNSRSASNYPGSLMGRSDDRKADMCNKAMNVTEELNSNDVYSTTFVMIFDASKWSPKSCGAQVGEYHDFWSEVYDVEALKSLKGIGCNHRILNTTDGVKFYYQNQGADLEGYRTRTSTMYHADMLAAACRRGVNKGYIIGASNLVVFVDDGAVKFEAKGEGKEADANALLFLEELKKVYAAGGQTIHNRKVVISRRGGEILANFYLDGVLLPQGIKAAMKLSPDEGDPTATLPNEMDSLFAASQGAVKAGANPFITYARYIKACIRSIYKFNRRTFTIINPKSLALALIVPKSMGGFGLQSFQGLMTTTVTNQTAEGVSMMNRIVRSYPEYNLFVNRLLKTPILKRAPLDILRDPSRVRLALPTLVESRMIQLSVSKLKTMSPKLAVLLGTEATKDMIRHATSVAENMLRKDVISAPQLLRAWKATPLSQLEAVLGKFKKAETIIGLLGFKEVGKVRRANLRDVKKVQECMFLIFKIY